MSRTIRTLLTLAAASLALVGSAQATPRQIAALNWTPRSDWANVKLLSPAAVGDGVADDTAALQHALDAMRDGSTLYLPAGVYRITKPLTLTGPRHGALIVGNGCDTRLVWDGEPGGKMLIVNGVAYSDYRGIAFEGRGIASIGIWHNNDKRFETEIRNQQLSFKGFTEGGILTDAKCPVATAEISFEDCVFEDCGRGVGFYKFNDYDFSLSGCDFRRCGIAIECDHGNFYARDCHFEGSATMDVRAAGEHCCSLRRCTSVGSARFVSQESPVAALAIQDCRVDGWTASGGAVRLAGAPVTMFDCRFSHAPAAAGIADSPVVVANPQQRLVVSSSATDGPPLIAPQNRKYTYNVPDGKRGGVVTSAQESFLRSTVRIPKRVFDAKRDFGAKGDGKTDDTKAVQATIEAASTAGHDAIAYLPLGAYVVTQPLKVTGHDFFFGGSGSGWSTRLLWRGDAGAVPVEVRDARNVAIEHMMVDDNGRGPASSRADIVQTGTGQPTSVLYDAVWVYGCYVRDPFHRGIVFENLGPRDTVVVQQMRGNMHFVNCGAATVIANNTYEGSVVVDGKSGGREGLIGYQFRLATLVTHPLYVRDSNSIVVSDLYVEQAASGLYFEGHDGDPAGRATIQGAKLNTSPGLKENQNFKAFDIHNYRGQIFFGSDQFYIDPNPLPICQTGANPVSVTVYSTCFYGNKPELNTSASANVNFIGNQPFGFKAHGARYDPVDATDPAVLPSLSLAFDDLRRLGAADVALNYPAAQ